MFELEKFHRNVTDKELIDDLLKTYNKLNKKGIQLTTRSYADYGKYSAWTIYNRFGTWNKALELAGIEQVKAGNGVTEEELLINLKNVWLTLGRQPRSEDMVKPASKYSPTPYKTKFGTWRKALEALVSYCEAYDSVFKEEPNIKKDKEKRPKIQTKKTKRSISDRLRFKILMRDGFTCKSCGASATNQLGTELHVDHIIPWSKGGETEEMNLETKCKKCNLGKGNAFNQ